MRWLPLTLLAACAEPTLLAQTQVVVALYGERELGLTRVEVQVRDEAGLNVVSEHAFDPLGELPLSFGVYQPERGADWFTLVARGYSGDTRVVEYKVIAQFVAGQTGLLSVTLANRCAGVFCDESANETCYAEVGRCVPVARQTPDVVGEDASTVVGETERADAGVDIDAAEPPSIVAKPVPPSSHGFPSLGGRRGDGVMTVSGDGFERGERLCTSDGRYCVTGSFSP
jgi:hypothetical protein